MEVPLINNTGERVRRNLTDQERQSIYEIFLRQSNDGKIPRGMFKIIAGQFFVSVDTIRRVWSRAMQATSQDMHVDVSSRMQGNVGRKRIIIEHEKIHQVPWRRRTNIRSFANALEVSKSTLHRRVRDGFIHPHSNAIKPILNDENKRKRLRFCLSLVEAPSPHNNPKFVDMYDYVHIDEKWFYLSKETQRYYMLPSEEQPVRTCQSKSFIPKVMFLAAVARPRYDTIKGEMFDGKLGIFPFTYMEPAKRNSKNRNAGTLEMKSMTSVNKDVIRLFLIEKVLPAIRAKWPQDGPRKIVIQQDNARPHIQVDDVDFNEAAKLDGFDMQLRCQPPNSPDLNVLDLGYFRAIQSLQHQEAPENITELVRAVEESFRVLSSESLNNVFLTLQLCMMEVMKCYGDNNYKIPHIGKKRLERQGALPTQIEIENQIVVQAQNHLQHAEV